MTIRQTPTPAELADPALAFTPVPRKPRIDGWTPERQHAFIAALARLGTVVAAARQVAMSAEGAYYLRRQKGAESFARAWARAHATGVHALRDIAYERAIQGTLRGIWYKGERVGEERRHHDRLLMFMLRHEQPAAYGAQKPLRPGTKHPDTLAREARWEEAEDAEFADGDDLTSASNVAKIESVERTLGLYCLKVAVERRDRLAGNFVGADFALRQLTILEVLLSAGPGARDLVGTISPSRIRSGDPEIYMTPAAKMFAAVREKAWEDAGEPLRPVVQEELGRSSSLRNGGNDANWDARLAAQKEATRLMAHAQALWEATATEETWGAWKGRGD